MNATYQFSNAELIAIRDKLKNNQMRELLPESAKTAKLIHTINTILATRSK